MFKDLKIGTRLGLGFGVVFVLFCALTMFSINRMQFLAENTSLIYNHPLTVSNAVLRINADIVKIHRAMKDVALDMTTADIERDSRLVDKLEKRVQEDFDVIDKWFLGDKTLHDKAYKVFVEWKPIRDEVNSLMRAEKRSQAADITRGKGALHVVKIENAMEALTLFAQGKASEFLGSAEKTTQLSLQTMYVLLISAMVIVIVFTFYLTRSITRPLKALQEATREIGRGRFDVELDVEAGGEIGELATSITEMSSNLSWVTASRDELNKEINERKQMEEARQKLMNDLEDKASEMERFVYTVSHDLKSPLITIQGFLGLLEQDAVGGDKACMVGDISQIRTAAGQMQNLLADLLEISRIGRLVTPSEEVGFRELVEDAVALLAGQLNESEVQLDIAPDLPILFGDRKRLLEVVQNLIDNALKFMGEQSAPHIKIGARQENDETICYIMDNGIGVEPKYHEKVFELFERLNPAVEGTGIGLAIVKRIIVLQGGRIWVESQGEGKGATFCFVLPRLR